MYFLKCDRCGHFNPVDSEYLVYCGKCKTHLPDNYIDWVGKYSDKNFDDYKRMMCVTESEVPKHAPTLIDKKPQVKEEEIAPPQQKQKKRLTRAQWIGLVTGALFAGIFSFLGKKAAVAVKEYYQISKMRGMDFAPSDTTNWNAFQCTEASFSMNFPKVPTESAQVVETEIGNLEVKQYIFEPELGKDPNILYGAGFTTYPAEYIDGEQMDEEQLAEFFENSINGTVQNVQGRLLSTHIINYKGFPGREIKVDVRDGLAVIKMRSYLIRNHMYIVQVISPSSNTFNKSINYFLDSFELNE
ncbi:hypothetical protein [uncultured Draconibacterium sp.]|uniref:hypothetical protein n=1 Tax=uncultured Draconibacterium sp. TaxID=1573823 RepID=UPI00321680A8